MSLSPISSNLAAVTEAAAAKATLLRPAAQSAPAAPAADTVTISPAAQKLQSGDVDSDGDSH